VSKRTHLHVVVYSDAVELGGAEISAAHLVAYLPQDFAVTVVGVDADIVARVAGARPGARAEVTAPSRGPADVRAVAAHVGLLRRVRPDVVHLSLASPWSCQHALVACSALRHTPVVAVYHLCVPALSRRQQILRRLTSRRISAHVAVGFAVAREVEELLRLRSGVVRTIYNGIPDGSLARSRPGPDGATVVCVGRLEHQKGFDVLLDALARVPRGRLLLVGDGRQRRALEERAHRLGLADRVRLTGWVEDPRTVMVEADVFALPSRFEGFPLSVLEAMLAGLPVLATDVGSVREAVIHDQTGLLIDPDDADSLAAALERLLTDEPERRRYGQAGRELALARFLADHMANAYAELYRELVR
jgi:glycosyltransferase involved in cell wall biosynthesis